MKVFFNRAILLFSVLLIGGLPAFAQSQQSATTSTQESAKDQSSELENLEPYKSIAVIQKKLFPKTERWEIYLSGVGSLNNKLFTSVGAKAHLGYHFNERWAVEGQAWYLGQISRDLTGDLEDNYQIASSDIVTPEAFLGLNLIWSPIYGKLSLFEKTINPFELYFSFGGGLVMTDDGQNAPAAHLAFGQIHPISTQTIFRWEIGGNIFQAEGKDSLQGDAKGKKVMSEIVYVSMGVSFYFPEVKRR